MLLTLWSFFLSQGQRNELHCREGLEGPVWHRDCSGWQTWFLQWQEKVSVSASVVLCCASFLPLGGSLTTVNSRTLYTECAYTVGLSLFPLSLYYNRVSVCVFFPRRPFRRVTDKGAMQWDRIHRLEKGKIYKQVLCQRITTTCQYTDFFRNKIYVCLFVCFFNVCDCVCLITVGKSLWVPETHRLERIQSALLRRSHLQWLGSKQQLVIFTNKGVIMSTQNTVVWKITRWWTKRGRLWSCSI